MKILHVPSECGNVGPIMAKCQRDLGCDAKSIVFAANHVAFPADENLIKPGRSKLDLIKLEFLRWWVLCRALSYDVIHYNYGSSIVPTPIFAGEGQHGARLRSIYSHIAAKFFMFDVPLLKKLGKTICVTFNGGDARQGNKLRARYKWSDADEEPPGYYTAYMDKVKAWRIRQWDKYADHIYYVNPDLGWVLPERAKFLPYPCCDPKEIKFKQRPLAKRIEFGHIVNHREPKGTKYVLEDMLEFVGRSYFVFREKLQHSQAMKVYAYIDILLEQFVLGWYGGQAVECMSMGIIPVFFIRAHDCYFVPVEMLSDLRRASLQTPKENLRITIKNIVDGKYPLEWYSQNARNYALKWHDPHKIAAQTIGDYQQKGR